MLRAPAFHRPAGTPAAYGPYREPRTDNGVNCNLHGEHHHHAQQHDTKADHWPRMSLATRLARSGVCIAHLESSAASAAALRSPASSAASIFWNATTPAGPS